MSLQRAWTAIALVALNAAVLFALLNLGALLGLALWPDHSTRPKLSDYALTRLYPDYPLATARRMLDETWERGYVYEPFTQFREQAVDGEFVTVHPQGFRVHSTDQPWPPPDQQALFFFGGSTTFGYGERDEATLAFFAQQALRQLCGDGGMWVYNFARSNYFSTQERILFEQLLRSGSRPQAVVFVDGVNEFLYPSEEPKFTRRLSYLMTESEGQLLARAVGALPLVEMLQRLSGLRSSTHESSTGGAVDSESIADRWHANRRLVSSAAEAHQVAPHFVWQPSPAYAFDLARHEALAEIGGPLPALAPMRAGYETMAARLRADPGNDILWLADEAPDLGRPLYVDRFHYSAAFAEHLGERIAGWLAPRVCPSSAAGNELAE